MNHEVRYHGTFNAIDGTRYRVEILQEGSGMYESTPLSFPGTNALTIEWPEVDKLEPIVSSRATLVVISTRDRMFTDLYSTREGRVLLKVYRGDKLYWVGSLDTELYEEPYAFLNEYEVVLTFADFSPLKREKFTSTGFISINSIIENSISICNLEELQRSEYISTFYKDKRINFEQLKVISDNFQESDGEPMKLYDVLSEVLRIFGVSIRQKKGIVYLYDLNKLYTTKKHEVLWSSTDSMYSVDKIYNNVKVIYSPYADPELFKAKINFKKEDSDRTDIVKFSSESEETGFLISSGNKGTGIELSNGAKFFSIEPVLSGYREKGFAWGYRIENDWVGNAACGIDRIWPIAKTERVFVGGNLSESEIMNYRIRLNLDVLFDVRLNPFEPAGKENEEGNFERLQDWCNFAYVPILLTLYDAEGNEKYHYSNRGVMDSNGFKHDYSLWKKGGGSWGEAFLCYYDFENRKSASGLGGWKTNKRIIGYYRKKLPHTWSKMPDGEYIHFPPEPGWLQLEIGSGIHQFDYKRMVKDIYSRTRWVLYRNPSMTVVKEFAQELEDVDVEDAAYLHDDAKEAITISTFVGTMKETSACARGVIYDKDMQVATSFTRAGVNDRLERLLIGTVYSQYADRKILLSGTVELLADFNVYADRSLRGKKFMLLSEVQHVQENESEVLMSELSKDNYEGIDFSNV